MIVLGYHGTSATAAARILAHGFASSRNDYDWLGDGAYFFQDAPERAREWARERFGADAAVIGAELDLADCLDLLDIQWHDLLRQCYHDWAGRLRAAGHPLPRQTTGAHRLDREVINRVVGILERSARSVSAVRAAFVEGEPLFPGSALMSRMHVQIAVREPAAIVRSWILRHEGDRP